MATSEKCACGCGGERPLYIQGHDRRDFLAYTVEDRGYATPCWITGAKDGTYAQVRAGGVHVGAHRMAYEQAKGPIPEGYHIDHLCRVTNCINPEHLEAVPPKENVRRTTQVKLNPDLVREIRASSESGPILGERLRVSRSLISMVRRRKIWMDVE